MTKFPTMYTHAPVPQTMTTCGAESARLCTHTWAPSPDPVVAATACSIYFRGPNPRCRTSLCCVHLSANVVMTCGEFELSVSESHISILHEYTPCTSNETWLPKKNCTYQVQAPFDEHVDCYSACCGATAVPETAPTKAPTKAPTPIAPATETDSCIWAKNDICDYFPPSRCVFLTNVASSRTLRALTHVAAACTSPTRLHAPVASCASCAPQLR